MRRDEQDTLQALPHAIALTRVMADLYFQKPYKPEGISTLAMSQYDGSPEPVIRELLQNSLDAASEAGLATEREPADICFRISDVPIASVPGLQSYRRAFESVAGEHEGKTRSPDSGVVIARIRKALNGGTLRCLTCRDNGIGLNEDRLRRILAEAHSNKAEGGGSFGVGHMTAFSASDLRYVLYAGRSKSENGTNRELVSGHAVLSSHKDQEGIWRSADGYLMEEQSDLFSPSFSQTVPAMLSEDLKKIDQFGAVVCIMGFNGFREDGEGTQSVVDAICRVASTNFLLAISLGKMCIRIRDEIGEKEEIIDSQTVGEYLSGVANRKRVRGAGKGWIAGEQAYRAWQTVESGRQLNAKQLNAGQLDIWFRNLNSQQRQSPRVNLFRDGMWITKDAPKLQRADFADVGPFDAVVSLVEGPLYKLVRGAEGPEHRGIERKRLAARDRRKLNEQLEEVKRLLRSEADELSDRQEFVPQGFAVFPGERLRGVDVLPRYRPRLSEGEGEAIVPKPGPGPGPRTGSRRPNPRMPKRGRAVSLRSSLAPSSTNSGPIDRLEVRWEPTDRKFNKDARVGIRIRRASGSDETCEQPIPPDWLKLKAVEIASGQITAAFDNSQCEAIVPAHVGHLTIVLDQPLNDLSGIQLDFVRRKKAA